ncbi:MAG: sensor histidine kinase [Verrucomicrobia bacterium]|nr:MAG: sensor histidine kinase [Verrucomicrobiota bacterium]
MAALLAVVLNLRGSPWIEALALGLGLCLPYALVCGSSYYMARAMPLKSVRLLQVLTSLVGASALAGALWVSAANSLSLLLPAVTGGRLIAQLWLLYGLGVAYFVLSLVYHYLILAMEETRRVEVREQEARVLTREAELRALKFQVNPHFLFNSLNAIAALTMAEPEQARRMCQLLSSFLRTSLRLGDRDAVTLKEELGLVRSYLDIELVRFSDRLTVEQTLAENCLDLKVPPLLLQPLIENAVKHGIGTLPDGGTITLAVARESDRLRLSVENPLDPDEPARPGSGRGLQIVEERLGAFYGQEARMVIDKNQQRFRVELIIPI